MTDIPPLPTRHDERELLPPDPAAWQDAEILRTEKSPDGSWLAVLVMGSLDYDVRAYRMEDGTVKFQFQARRCRKAEAAFIRYVDGLGSKLAG
jgi:hypothetical protein